MIASVFPLNIFDAYNKRQTVPQFSCHIYASKLSREAASVIVHNTNIFSTLEIVLY